MRKIILAPVVLVVVAGTYLLLGRPTVAPPTTEPTPGVTSRSRDGPGDNNSYAATNPTGQPGYY